MAMNHAKIAKLVEKVKDNDSQAFTSLYEMTYQRMYFLAYSILKNEQDAQDVVQETYIKILKHIKSLKDGKAFVKWAEKVVYTISIREISKRKSESMDDEVMNSIPDDESSNPLSKTVAKNDVDILTEHIYRLDPVLRSTLIFKYFDGYKITTISKIMECPEGTVKSRLSIAKKKLRESLTKSGRRDVYVGFFI